MPAVAGRSSNEGRSVPGVVTTNAVATITAPAGSFQAGDVGRTISGAGIPAGRTILSVQSPTAATMSGAASASGTVTATLGPGNPLLYGFVGWSPESEAESLAYSVAANNAGTPQPDRPVNAITERARRSRA